MVDQGLIQQSREILLLIGANMLLPIKEWYVETMVIVTLFSSNISSRICIPQKFLQKKQTQNLIQIKVNVFSHQIEFHSDQAKNFGCYMKLVNPKHMTLLLTANPNAKDPHATTEVLKITIGVAELLFSGTSSWLLDNNPSSMVPLFCCSVPQVRKICQ